MAKLVVQHYTEEVAESIVMAGAVERGKGSEDRDMVVLMSPLALRIQHTGPASCALETLLAYPYSRRDLRLMLSPKICPASAASVLLFWIASWEAR